MSINLINYALAKKDWEKAYEDLKVLGVGGRNLIPKSNDFLTWYSYSDQISIVTGFSLPEANINDASRIQISGGSNVIKMLRTIIDYVVRGEKYTISLYIKNIGTKPVIIQSNGFSPVFNTKVEPDQYIRFVATSTVSQSTTPQIQIRAENADDELEFIIARLKVEEGEQLTNWTPAPEDISAHPFVAELAETVYRSKQNEERIRNLENALTALGGGS